MRKRITNQFQILASLTLMGLLFILSYVSYITPESDSLHIALKMVDQHTAAIEQLPVISEHYLLSGNRNSLDKLTKYASEINRTLHLLDSGGQFKYKDKEYTLPRIDELEFRRRLGEMQTQFGFHFDKIKVLESQPLYTEERKELSVVHKRRLSYQNIEFTRNINEAVLEAYEYISSANRVLTSRITALSNSVHEEIEDKNFSGRLFRFIIMTITALLAARTTVLVVMNYLRPFENVVRKATQLSGMHRKKGHNRVKFLSDTLNTISNKFQAASDFALAIGEGNFTVELQQISVKEPIGASLLEMRNKLKNYSDSEAERAWLSQGLTRVADILNENQKDTFEELAYLFIQFVVKHLNINQGGVFLINDSDKIDVHIRQYSCFAYNKRKFLSKRIELNEGLIGQSIAEAEEIYMSNVPRDYMTITSGLGQETPGYLLIMPITHEENVLGAVEVASFHPISDLQREFLRESSHKLGAIVSVVQVNHHTQTLLEQSQYVNNELQKKEELMRKNTQELQQTQRRLNDKLRELEKESNLVRNIVDAINKTSASIEFDLDGKIMEVNDMYLSIMGYTREELIGKNESKLVPEDEMESGRYHMSWESIKGGSYMSGEYRRISKTGKEVWLNGTYNPIFDTSGRPYKVIQFAQFTTEEKEKDLDYSSKINSMSASFPFVDIGTDGVILSANQTFLEWLGFKRKDSRKKHLEDFTGNPEKLKGLVSRLYEGEPFSEELLMLDANGEQKYSIVKFHPLQNLSGAIHKTMVIFVDLTQNKQLELQLQKERQKLMDSLASIHSQQKVIEEVVILFELDMAGRFLSVSPQLAEKLGVSVEQMVGTRLKKYISDESVAKQMEGYISTKDVNAVFRSEALLSISDSQWFWADLTFGPLLDNENNLLKFVGIMMDVTTQVEQKKNLQKSLQAEKAKNVLFKSKLSDVTEKTPIEAALEDLLAKMEDKEAVDPEKIVEQSALPALLVDKSLLILKINNAAQEALGASGSKKKIQFTDLIDGVESQELEQIEKAISGGSILEKELNFRGIEKNLLLKVKLLSVPIFTPSGQAQAVVLFQEATT